MGQPKSEKPEAADTAQQKEIIKEALQEWLDNQFAKFGKWTLTGLLAAAFSALVYLWLAGHGFAVSSAMSTPPLK